MAHPCDTLLNTHSGPHFNQLWQRLYGARPAQWQVQHALVNPPGQVGRPVSDALAAWQRWHGVHEARIAAALFSAAQWPWYAVLERARVEVLASRHLPGMALNLQHDASLAPADPLLADLYALARAVWLRGNTAAHVQPPHAGRWAAWFRRARPPGAAAIRAALSRVAVHLDDGATFAHAVQPLVYDLAATRPLRAQVPRRAGARQQQQQHAAVVARPDAGKASKADAGTLPPDYGVFSRAHDECAPAARWLQPEDRARLAALQPADPALYKVLARRLQQRLLVHYQPRWLFDQDSGQLDSRRLARLLHASPSPLVFRQQAADRSPQAAVVFLVDASGSMRGPRMQMAALAVDFAVQVLELCGVLCEVLAYTTGFGTHNPLREQWLAAGAPAAPGRLNAVRHVVLKSASQPWRRTRAGLGLLLRDDFGQDNIDGEAVQWAATRLARLPCQHNKVLLVLSDGAPYDEATAIANGRDYLTAHLRQVIRSVEASPLRLAALGIGHDVGRFYQRAANVFRDSDIAPVLFDRLEALLTGKDRPS